MDETAKIIETGQRWADAERTGDAAALSSLLADDFRGVGPVGFVLDKTQWIGRLAGARYDRLSWDDVGVRQFGDVAVAIGEQAQDGEFGDHRVRGSFRMTQVLVRDGDGWRIASIHLCPMAETFAA